MFAKVCKSIGNILVAELQKEVDDQKDESINKLFTLITKIGEQYESKTVKENGEGSKEEIKEKSKEKKEDNEKKNKEERKVEGQEENKEENKVEIKEENKIINDKMKIKNTLDKDNNKEIENKNKILFNFPKAKQISEYLNVLGNESIYKFSYHLLKAQNKNEPQKLKCDSQTMNGF